MKVFIHRCKLLTLICAIVGMNVLATSAHAKDPETFQELMKYMGEQYTQVVDGILKQDYDQIDKAANIIAFHPEPSLTQRMKIIAKLGTNFLDFKSWDDKVHLSAVALSQAAKTKDQQAILEQNSQVLKNCTSCHDKYRDIVKSLRQN